MADFLINGRIQLSGPTNPSVSQIAADMRQQFQAAFGAINIPIGPPPNAAQGLRNIQQITQATATNVGNTVTQLNQIPNAITNVATRSTQALTAQNTVTRQVVSNLEKVKSETKQIVGLTDAFLGGVQVRFSQFLKFAVASSIVDQFRKAYTAGIDSILKMDSAQVKLQQVTERTRGEVNSLTSSIIDFSRKWGTSASEMLDASTILAQAGYNLREIKGIMQEIGKTSLSPSFDNLTDTLDGVIAAMAQFKIGAGNSNIDDVSKFLDTVNTLSKKYAVESADILESIKTSGSIFAAASGIDDITDAKQRLSLAKEYATLITSVRSNTRLSAPLISTGLRSTLQRFQRPQTEEELRNILGRDFTLRDQEGKFIGVVNAIVRIKEALQDASTTGREFAAVVEALGGTRQSKVVIPLIQDASSLKKFGAEASLADESVLEDAILSQDKLETKFQKIRGEFQAFVNAIATSSGFKDFTDQVIGLTRALIGMASAIKPILPLLWVAAGLQGASFLGRNVARIAFPGANLSQTFTPSSRRIPGGTRGFNNGGIVPSILTPGELVFPPGVANRIGMHNLNRMNSGKISPFDSAYVSGASIVPGMGFSDTVPADLPVGSYVIKKSAAERMRRGYTLGGSVKYNQQISQMVDDFNFKTGINFVIDSPNKSQRRYQELYEKLGVNLLFSRNVAQAGAYGLGLNRSGAIVDTRLTGRRKINTIYHELSHAIGADSVFERIHPRSLEAGFANYYGEPDDIKSLFQLMSDPGASMRESSASLFGGIASRNSRFRKRISNIANDSSLSQKDKRSKIIEDFILSSNRLARNPILASRRINSDILEASVEAGRDPLNRYRRFSKGGRVGFAGGGYVDDDYILNIDPNKIPAQDSSIIGSSRGVLDANFNLANVAAREGTVNQLTGNQSLFIPDQYGKKVVFPDLQPKGLSAQPYILSGEIEPSIDPYALNIDRSAIPSAFPIFSAQSPYIINGSEYDNDSQYLINASNNNVPPIIYPGFQRNGPRRQGIINRNLIADKPIRSAAFRVRALGGNIDPNRNAIRRIASGLLSSNKVGPSSGFIGPPAPGASFAARREAIRIARAQVAINPNAGYAPFDNGTNRTIDGTNIYDLNNTNLQAGTRTILPSGYLAVPNKYTVETRTDEAGNVYNYRRYNPITKELFENAQVVGRPEIRSREEFDNIARGRTFERLGFGPNAKNDPTFRGTVDETEAYRVQLRRVVQGLTEEFEIRDDLQKELGIYQGHIRRINRDPNDIEAPFGYNRPGVASPDDEIIRYNTGDGTEGFSEPPGGRGRGPGGPGGPGGPSGGPPNYTDPLLERRRQDRQRREELSARLGSTAFFLGAGLTGLGGYALSSENPNDQALGRNLVGAGSGIGIGAQLGSSFGPYGVLGASLVGGGIGLAASVADNQRIKISRELQNSIDDRRGDLVAGIRSGRVRSNDITRESLKSANQSVAKFTNEQATTSNVIKAFISEAYESASTFDIKRGLRLADGLSGTQTESVLSRIVADAQKNPDFAKNFLGQLQGDFQEAVPGAERRLSALSKSNAARGIQDNLEGTDDYQIILANELLSNAGSAEREAAVKRIIERQAKEGDAFGTKEVVEELQEAYKAAGKFEKLQDVIAVTKRSSDLPSLAGVIDGLEKQILDDAVATEKILQGFAGISQVLGTSISNLSNQRKAIGTGQATYNASNNEFFIQNPSVLTAQGYGDRLRGVAGGNTKLLADANILQQSRQFEEILLSKISEASNVNSEKAPETIDRLINESLQNGGFGADFKNSAVFKRYEADLNKLALESIDSGQGTLTDIFSNADIDGIGKRARGDLEKLFLAKSAADEQIKQGTVAQANEAATVLAGRQTRLSNLNTLRGSENQQLTNLLNRNNLSVGAGIRTRDENLVRQFGTADVNDLNRQYREVLAARAALENNSTEIDPVTGQPRSIVGTESYQKELTNLTTKATALSAALTEAATSSNGINEAFQVIQQASDKQRAQQDFALNYALGGRKEQRGFNRGVAIAEQVRGGRDINTLSDKEKQFFSNYLGSLQQLDPNAYNDIRNTVLSQVGSFNLGGGVSFNSADLTRKIDTGVLSREQKRRDDAQNFLQGNESDALASLNTGFLALQDAATKLSQMTDWQSVIQTFSANVGNFNLTMDNFNNSINSLAGAKVELAANIVVDLNIKDNIDQVVSKAVGDQVSAALRKFATDNNFNYSG